MKVVIFIIIIVIGLGIGLYFYNSGAFVKGVDGFNALFPAPTSSLSGGSGSSSSGGGSFWSFLSDLGPSASFTGPSIPPPQGGETIITAPPPSGSGGSSGSGAPTNPNLTSANIPAGFTLAQLSPYFEDVRIGGVSAATFGSYGTITLDDNDYYNATGTIDVTGWKIQSNIGNEFIPQAVNLYDPTGFAPATDIVLKQGDTVYLYSTSAPFNLRLNECTGYMAGVANFVPAIPLTCPYIDQSQIQQFSGQCQQFIQSIGQCQQPNMSSPQVPQNDYACIQYLLNNFTYRSCFDQHSADANFLSNQVLVWTGSNIIDQYHNTVELLDKNGLLVDIYSY